MLFKYRGQSAIFGPTWREMFSPRDTADITATSSDHLPSWWRVRRKELLELARTQTPLYVYDSQTIQKQTDALRNVSAVSDIYYAIKANSNADILRQLERNGLGFECVSIGEVEHVLSLFPDISPQRILFTPNFAPAEEYSAAFERDIRMTLDNIYPLQAWPDLFKGREIFVRLDPGRGRGHHHHVRTAGAESKFGIAPSHIKELRKITDQLGVTVKGLHAHAGSGILTPQHWRDIALFLIDMAEHFPSVEILNLGGGIGIPERPEQQDIDLHALNDALLQVRDAHPRFSLWLEPGRFIVAQAGILLTRVTQTKRKGDILYIGVNTGMNSLIRPALYGSWHEIINLSYLGEPASNIVNIVGPICESGDTLGHDRPLPPTREGDILIVATVGAYGSVMSSRYNLRSPADEYFLHQPN